MPAGDEQRSPNWLLENARVTAFPAAGPEVAADRWWSELLTEPAEAKVTLPRVGRYEERGKLGNGFLVLRAQSGRIDWLLTVSQRRALEEPGIPSLGPFPEAIRGFLDATSRWLELPDIPQIQRLAFGATLVHPTESAAEAQNFLTPMLPSLRIASEHTSDLTFQINRPRKSAVSSGITVNRLSRWSVVAYSIMTMEVASQPSLGVLNEQRFAAQLQTDVNTAADLKGELPRTILRRHLQELVDLGQEIAEKGDIA